MIKGAHVFPAGDAYLEQHYTGRNSREMAAALGCSRGSVHRRVGGMGLAEERRDERRQRLRKLWNAGMPTGLIAETLGVSKNTVQLDVRALKLTPRTREAAMALTPKQRVRYKLWLRKGCTPHEALTMIGVRAIEVTHRYRGRTGDAAANLLT